VRKSSRLSALVLFAAVLILSACDPGNDPGITPTPVLRMGPPAPWSEQVAFARREAQKVDEGVFLLGAQAKPENNPPSEFNPDKPLAVTIAFVRYCSFDTVVITIADTSPPTLLSVQGEPCNIRTTPTTLPDPNYIKERQEYEEALAITTLGPRDIYSLTAAEGAKYSDPPLVRLDVLVGSDAEDKLGVPAIWTVGYLDDSLVPPGKDLILRIHPGTGEILRREETGDVTPTP
jgi:hypothetical protein